MPNLFCHLYPLPLFSNQAANCHKNSLHFLQGKNVVENSIDTAKNNPALFSAFFNRLKYHFQQPCLNEHFNL
jgi:hypothetical protein